ncbi:MAG: DUF6491 family protein [Steroidobacter sp.]
MRKAFLLISALTACAGANADQRASSNECVFARSITDFKPLDRNHLVIWSPGRRNAYLVELAMPLPELRFAHRLAVVDRNRDGRLCGYGMDRIIVGDSSFQHPATIAGMTRLDEGRIAALEAQYDVRLTRKRAASENADAPQSEGQ